MVPVAVTLLGGFEIRVDGAARELPGAKDRALLAVLALPPGAAHSRDELAGLLWSDRGDSQARDSLKHALARLRAALRTTAGTSPLAADRQSVRLDPTALQVDAAELERLLADGAPTPSRRRLRSTAARCSTASASATPPSKTGCSLSVGGCAVASRMPLQGSSRIGLPRATGTAQASRRSG